MATKLDISAAFDSLHHSAVARYFVECKPSREALLLQTIVAGLLQGSFYSA